MRGIERERIERPIGEERGDNGIFPFNIQQLIKGQIDIPLRVNIQWEGLVVGYYSGVNGEI